MNSPRLLPTTEAYGELQRAFSHFNEHLFENQLPECLITFQREKSTYGYFSSERFVHRDGVNTTDEIAINPAYFAIVPIGEILQTIAHEMVHAWQFRFGKPSRRGYHNQEWADKMESIGLMPSSTGQPGGKKTGEKMADYAIEGGRFLDVCADLLKSDFKVSWLDRFPPAPQERLLRGRGDRQQQLMGLPQQAQAMIQAVVEPVNKSNRVKQRCPNCGAQAWGKPGLKLLCGEPDCEAQSYEETQAS